MAPRPLVAGNWKMNGLAASIGQLKAMIAGAGNLPKVELMVCPPATLIASFAAAARGTPVLIGGQDCHALASGAYTGDISAEMLKDAGASAVRSIQKMQLNSWRSRMSTVRWSAGQASRPRTFLRLPGFIADGSAVCGI